MISSLLLIAAAIATPFGYWWLRRLRQRDDPVTKAQEIKDETNKAIISGDANYINGSLDKLLPK